MPQQAVSQQEEIEVWLNDRLVTVVPKAAESWIRKEYYGKPEEKILIIKPRIPVSPEQLQSIVQKLQP